MLHGGTGDDTIWAGSVNARMEIWCGPGHDEVLLFVSALGPYGPPRKPITHDCEIVREDRQH